MRRLKTSLLAAVATLMGGAAMAADLPVTKAPLYSPPPAAPFSWTSIYVGIHGGYEFGSPGVTGIFTNPAEPATNTSGSLPLNSSGGFGGGHIGFDYQYAPSWVVGVRVDGDVSGLAGTAVTTTAGTMTATTSVPWHADVVGKLGFIAAPQVMIYGVGGVAFGEIKNGATLTTFAPLTADNVHTGWVAGGGIEYLISRNLSIGAEWNHFNLGTQGVTFVGAGPTPATFNVSNKAEWDSIKGFLSVRF